MYIYMYIIIYYIGSLDNLRIQTISEFPFTLCTYVFAFSESWILLTMFAVLAIILLVCNHYHVIMQIKIENKWFRQFIIFG